MALAPLSLAVEEPRSALAGRDLPPSTVPLALLPEMPGRASGRHWAAILAGSIVLHIIFFTFAVRVPSLIGHFEPERRVVVRHIPLYLPPDLMTQKAPNRTKVTKNIDLASLLASEASRPAPSAPKPSARHFELPSQAPKQPVVKNMPQILPDAPAVNVNQTATALPPGSPTGLTNAPPPPSPTPGPFQNIGGDTPPNPHPTLAPPKANVQAAVNGLTQSLNGRHLIISDDNPSQPRPGAPGTVGQLGAQHAAVELQSDPQGADFKAYLTQILAIVRTNWRRVIPESARMGTLRGRTVVEFIINRDGSIPKLVTAGSSGSDPLDRAAVAGLSMSNPLPPLPADYKGFQVRLAFSFAYNLPTQ